MNKTAIQKFAVEAHKALVRGVEQRAYNYGVTAEGCGAPDAATANGRVLTDRERSQRRELVEAVQAKGYAEVMEEAAYTWFNRFIALRYMEVNDYLPTHVRVFSNAAGAFEPEILREALHLDLPGLDRQRVAGYIEQNETDALYRYLLLTQCNALGESLPQLFERISGYTELLCPDGLLRPDSVLARMVADIPESDWTDQVQIIGWMYQYYNTEVKTETFDLLKKNVKVSKEHIPAATQLFTPEWIVRYMVENSLGRLFLEDGGQLPAGADEAVRIAAERRAAGELGWRYYLPEAEQAPEVRVARDRRPARPFDVTSLKILDPCMGSGHILVYAFDVLLQMYEKLGWNRRDAVASIVQNNLYGLEIDRRAAQLAYFAVMMKARQYDRRFLTRGIQPHLLDIPETGDLTTQPMHDMGIGLTEEEYSTAAKCSMTLLDWFRDGKEYGSLLHARPMDWALLRRFATLLRQGGQITMGEVRLRQAGRHLLALADAAELLAQPYDVVVTNPPYMGSSNMDAKLAAFVKKNYPDAKGDLFACFIERCGQMTKANGYQAMITQHSWMFLSSYEKLRGQLLRTAEIVNMAHLGARAFEEIGGEVVQTTSFVLRRPYRPGYRGVYARLVDYPSQQAKEEAFLDTDHCPPYTADQANFTKIPGAPVAYWVSENFIKAFESGISIDRISDFTGSQNITADNDKYLRYCWEVEKGKIGQGSTWAFYAKGGEYRKWYGNLELVVKCDPAALNFYKSNPTSNCLAEKYWFTEGITYSAVTSKGTGFRYYPPVGAFDKGGATICYVKDLEYVLALLNTKITKFVFEFLNPTINLQIKDVKSLPVIISESISDKVNTLCAEEIGISKEDWDAYETSWDFKKHPLV